MRVELARMEDVEAVVALERETAEAPHWADGEYRAAVAGGDEDLRRCLLVAQGEGQLLGFVVGRVVAGIGEIESVAVRAAARRCGAGRALCEAVIAWTREHGAHTVELEVRAESAGARALYAELGFVVCGQRPHYYRDPKDDAVLMRLALMSQG